jgi:hypothetical protein
MHMSNFTAIKERPILFNGAMVQAILNGTKTQTRRVIKPQPIWMGETTGQYWAWQRKGVFIPKYAVNSCPYGNPGDRLWVRETWAPVQACTHNDPGSYALASGAFYRASDGDMEEQIDRWRPSIHMPREASRITLEVKRVWVERVQNISEADAKREGWDMSNLPQGHADDGTYHARDWFQALWDSINAKRGYPWGDNPWVWCVEFKQINS